MSIVILPLGGGDVNKNKMIKGNWKWIFNGFMAPLWSIAFRHPAGLFFRVFDVYDRPTNTLLLTHLRN
jgi:hypothetical protein